MVRQTERSTGQPKDLALGFAWAKLMGQPTEKPTESQMVRRMEWQMG
jgi:hypothetical protein